MAVDQSKSNFQGLRVSVVWLLEGKKKDKKCKKCIENGQLVL